MNHALLKVIPCSKENPYVRIMDNDGRQREQNYSAHNITVKSYKSQLLDEYVYGRLQKYYNTAVDS